ncbi:hypothetical protein BC835DRAFT_1441584 [Cytidiella melzeri]|nr:hypothetical protein BC835DRAFT_1441584 [Cytidiella melzeri]
MWGKDWAQKTAERVQKVLQLNPCPIAYCSSWMSIEQSFWFVDAEQASAFPLKKEGKKANNGMLLRKRKAGAAAHVTFDPLAGVTAVGQRRGSGPVRTSSRERKGKTSDAAQIHEANGEMLEELSLPGVVVLLNRPSSSSLSTAFSPKSIHSGTPTKETKLELMGVNAPLAPSITASPTSAPVAQLSAPEPKRRSLAHSDLGYHVLNKYALCARLCFASGPRARRFEAGDHESKVKQFVVCNAVTVVLNASRTTTVVDKEASEKSKEVNKEVGMKGGKVEDKWTCEKVCCKKGGG